MAINIKNYIREALKNADIGVDSRPGSVWSDLVGNPLGHVLSSFDSVQSNIINDLSMTNVEQMTEAALDQMAANFLVTRSAGAYSYGQYNFFTKPL